MRLAAALFAVALALPALAPAQTRAEPEAAGTLTPKPLVSAREHMIVAAHPAASEAGRAMLRRGGSAADAAIAALLVLNVVEPQSSGIGGGAFALVHGPDGLVAWDARETAPAGARPGMFLGPDGAPLPFFEAVAGGHSVGVPGLVRLMQALHVRHGQLAWAELFAPAIRLAREGFPVSPRLAGLVARYRERLAAAPAAKLLLPEGEPMAEGEILTNSALAKTFERLAAEGPDAFYRGAIAEAVVAAVRAAPHPGSMTRKDLADYSVKARVPVCTVYRERFRICGMGPPSSGATTVGQILGLLETFAVGDLDLDSPRLWHLFAEASRLAYADRARYLADPDFVRVPVRGLLDPGYLAGRARSIDRERASEGRAEAGDPPWREGRLMAPQAPGNRPGTTHLSVVDGGGLAISLTASVEQAFGSGRMAAGFLLNNQLTDFSFRPTAEDGTPVANAAQPRKRPRSSMAPSIVYRTASAERPHILTGSPGGSRIPEYVAGALVAMLDFGADPAAAAALFHVSHRNRGNVALEEAAAPPGLADSLSAMGHEVERAAMTSGLHIIRHRDDGTLEGGADPRREGVALGD